MIIWSGFGILTPIIAVFNLVLVEYSVNHIFNNPTYYEQHGWPKFIALAISGALSFLVGRALNKKQKVYIDKETGKDVVLKPRNSFFFINMEYWAIIFPIIGLIFWITGN